MTVENKRMRKKVTSQEIRNRRIGDKKITLVTAYDYPVASWADASEIDIVFVSDALATVGLGRSDVYSVSIDEMVYHTKAVKEGAGNCLLLVAMPFLSYGNVLDATVAARRLIKEGGANALELEGGAETAEVIRALVAEGIPVVGHVGLTKKNAFAAGEYRIQGKEAVDIGKIIDDAIAVAEAGAFALILECIPDRVAEIISAIIDIPTIGFGAGPYCGGQALVTQDMLGMYDKFCPKFVRQYAEVGELVKDSFATYREEVSTKAFPAQKHTFSISDSVLAEVAKARGGEVKPFMDKKQKGGKKTKESGSVDMYVETIVNAIRSRATLAKDDVETGVVGRGTA